MNTSKIRLKQLTLVAALFMMGCQSSQTDSNGKLTVDVAFNIPLTGDVAVYGEMIHHGVSMALADMNQNGMMDSVSLNFSFQDNQSKNSEAVSILNKQFLSSPNVYVTGLDHQTSAMIDRISTEGIPHFTYSWEAFICRDYANTYRTGLNFEQESEFYMQFIRGNMPKRVAIVHVNDPGSFVQFDSIVIPQLRKLGINEIMYEAFDFADNEFKTLATKVKEYNPDLIIAGGYDLHLVPLIKDFRNYNLVKDGNMMCSQDMLDAAPNLSPEMLEGIRFTCPEFIYNPSEKVEQFNNKFKKEYNREAKYGDAYAYDMAQIILNAAKRANGDFSYDNFNKKLGETDMQGLTGPIKFNGYGDLVLNLSLVTYKDGKIIAVEK